MFSISKNLSTLSLPPATIWNSSGLNITVFTHFWLSPSNLCINIPVEISNNSIPPLCVPLTTQQSSGEISIHKIWSEAFIEISSYFWKSFQTLIVVSKEALMNWLLDSLKKHRLVIESVCLLKEPNTLLWNKSNKVIFPQISPTNKKGPLGLKFRVVISTFYEV